MPTSNITVDLITAGLPDVSPLVREVLESRYDVDKIQNLARRLGTDVVNYDNYLAAGRLLMYNGIRACSPDIRRYVKVLNHLLGHSTKKFMIENADAINAAISERRHLDYTSYDLMGASVLINGYLLTRGHDEDPAETPQQKHMRLAVQFHHHRGWDRVLKAYGEMSRGEYCHASPTQFNAGTLRAQMISCFLGKIADNLESILYQGVGDSGMICKLQGGLGLNLQLIRHSEIGDSGMSSGVIPFGRIYNATIQCVNQLGKRDGAATLFLRIHHLDIEDFIRSTDNFTNHELRFTKANTCIWMSRLFFKRVISKGKWTVFCPARAKELNDLYGYDFEKTYAELEIEAEKRDQEYQILKKKAAQLKNESLSDPDDEALADKYDRALNQKLAAKKARITHRILDADTLYTLIVNNQTRSAMPYIMHGDAVNAKSNQKNLGTIGASNLCLEITEHTTPEEMAACNLAGLNFKYFVKGKISWRAAVVSYAELQAVYDFPGISSSTRSAIENLEEVIDQNYYPLDERDEVTGSVIKRGKISLPNFKNRPVGLGGHGLSDAYNAADLAYDSPGAELLNKMIFACMYWNALIKSLELAIQYGPYETFRTGGYNRYLGGGQWAWCSGSPLSNGQFQFDLWAEDAQLLSDNGDLNEEVYNRDDDIPISPAQWGQSPTQIKCQDLNGTMVSFTIAPCWDSLRPYIMKYGVRHSLLIALMPTATTAQLFSNAESTEAHQAVMYTRTVNHGNFTIVVQQMIRDLKAIGLWTEKLAEFIKVCGGSIKYIHHYINDRPEEFPEADFHTPVEGDGRRVLKPDVADRLAYIQRKNKTMYEMSQKIPIRHARQRGIYVCQSQSLNIYAQDATVEQLKAIHSYTNAMGLKTGMYYLRMNPARFTGQFTIDPGMLQYVRELMLKIGESIQVLSQASTEEAVCEMKPDCISCQ